MPERVIKRDTIRDGVVANRDIAADNGAIDPRDPNAPDDVNANANGHVDPSDQRRTRFLAEQESRAQTFERDETARGRREEREMAMKAERSKRDAEIAERAQENQEAAFEDGLLTHDDLVNRRALLAPHTGCLEPWEVLADGEDTVRMAFPKTVVLTLSASDILRYTKDKYPDVEGQPGPIMHGARVVFHKGYQDVPVGLADHQYLYDNGAYRPDNDGKPEAPEARTERMKKAREEHSEEAAAH